MRFLGGILIIILTAVASTGILSEPIATTDGRDLEQTGSPVPPAVEIAGLESGSQPGDRPDALQSDDIAGSRDLSDDRCFPGDAGVNSAISGRLIIVDPGHGGEDLGTVDMQYGLTESELVLSIGWFLLERLTESGADVCLTRTGDYEVGLMERSEFANAQEGDTFISLHLNHLPDANQNYTMTMWGYEAKDKFLAETMLPVLAAEMASPEYYNGEPNPMDPDIVRLDHLDSNMLRNAAMPAVLVEASFLSNSWEARAFLDGIEDGSRWRERQIASAVHDGLLEYFEVFSD